MFSRNIWSRIVKIFKHNIILLHNLPWKNKNSWMLVCCALGLFFFLQKWIKTFLQCWKLCQRHLQGQIVLRWLDLHCKLYTLCLQYKNYSENKEIIVFESFSELLLCVCISFANELLGVNSIVLSFTVTCNNCLTNRFPFNFSYFTS